MKRYLIQGVLLGCILTLAIPASSAVTYTIGGTNVGEVDPLIAWADLSNSGAQTELQWVRTALSDQTVTLNTLDVDQYSFDFVDGSSSIIASLLQDSPEYFFIKTGPGNDSDFDHFLFRNLEELNYAVVDLAAEGVEIRNIGAISHVGETNGTSVPEAGALLMFGSGLIGLVGYRRMRRMQ